MKNLKTIAIALIAFVSLTANAQTGKKVDAKKSTINWVGKKVTGSHEGTINIKEGTLIFNGKKLVGGNVTVDMTSITCTDLSGEMKGKLEGHLKADDFFGTDKFETSKLVFKKIDSTKKDTYIVTADLTIKGITKSINFEIVVNGNTATANLKVDRTKYDIKYGSGSFFDGLGDKAINDEFELKVSLSF